MKTIKITLYNTAAEIKNLRREAIKVFLLLFVPWLIIVLPTCYFTDHAVLIKELKYQAIWFLVFFNGCGITWLFAPSLVRMFSKNQ